MKLWIVGSKGLLGRSLIQKCNDKNIEFVDTSHEDVDITHLDQLKKFSDETLSITHIINCAAFTNVDNAEKEPELAHAVNAIGPENIGIVAQRIGARAIHISTDYVFNGKGKRPYLETDDCEPIGVYGKTKLEGENNLLDVFPTACIIRSSWLFGNGGKNFISSILHRMRSDETLRVVSDQKGRPTLAVDLAEAVLSLLCHSGIFHFANYGEVSRFEMAQKIRERALSIDIPLVCREVLPVPTDFFPTPAKRPSYSVLSTNKIESLLGLRPRHWEEALVEYLAYAL